jgi:hypothetical protein
MEPPERVPSEDLWTRRETERLIETITSNFNAVEEIDWKFVSLYVKKSPQVCNCIELNFMADKECNDWFNCINELRVLMPNEQNKRRRRKANEIQRKFLCQVTVFSATLTVQEPRCGKSYGTEGSLKKHMAKKHVDIQYVPSYRKVSLESPAQPAQISFTSLHSGTSQPSAVSTTPVSLLYDPRSAPSAQILMPPLFPLTVPSNVGLPLLPLPSALLPQSQPDQTLTEPKTTP